MRTARWNSGLVRGVGLAFFGVVALAGCASDTGKLVNTRPETAIKFTNTLYDRLLGRDGVRSISDTWVQRMAKDPALRARFADADIPAVKEDTFDWLCDVVDGGCSYTGPALVRVSQAEYKAAMDQLAYTLAIYRVAPADRRELTAAVMKTAPGAIIAR